MHFSCSVGQMYAVINLNYVLRPIECIAQVYSMIAIRIFLKKEKKEKRFLSKNHYD